MLGGLGVAGAIHVHVKQKLRTAALLRCLGGSVGQVFSVYLAQGIALGAMGALLGAGAGDGGGNCFCRGCWGILFRSRFNFRWRGRRWDGRRQRVLLCVCFLRCCRCWRCGGCRPGQRCGSASNRRRGRIRCAGLSWPVPGGAGDGIWVEPGRHWRAGLGFVIGLGVVFVLLAVTAQGR